MTHGARRPRGPRRQLGLVAVLSGTLLSAAGAEQDAPAPSPATPAPGTTAPALEPDGYDYRIGPEDVLQITVWQNVELSRVLPVRPDGKISLPLVNDIQAAGLTPMQLRDSLKEKLAPYVPAAEISVIVGEVQSFNVSLIGKVQRANRYKLKGPTTVLDLLALAGGFAEFADTDRIVVLRPEPFVVQGRRTGQSFKRIPFNYKKVITAGGESENVLLQPGDIVVVP
jgi:polysaccharide biosynthesis/export protein